MDCGALSSSTPIPMAPLHLARQIILHESAALRQMASRLDGQFAQAVDRCLACQGTVVATGIGKAGLIAQKVSATLASTGTPSRFLHPSEAFHGDLGCLRKQDTVLAFSFSGETEETVRLLPSIQDLGVVLIAITGKPQSRLARAAAIVLDLGPMDEACHLGLAPSASTTAMLALGDALALVTSQHRNFTAEDFARFHPGGSLGRRLARVEQAMRPITSCRVGWENQTVRQLLVDLGKPGRRTGAIMLVDEQGRLTGVFTDSDLARLFENRNDNALDQPIRSVMSHSPACIRRGAMLTEAVEMLAGRRISELPVVDSGQCPCGILDITDVVALLPGERVGTDAARVNEGGQGRDRSRTPPPRDLGASGVASERRRSTIPFRTSPGHEPQA